MNKEIMENAKTKGDEKSLEKTLEVLEIAGYSNTDVKKSFDVNYIRDDVESEKLNSTLGLLREIDVLGRSGNEYNFKIKPKEAYETLLRTYCDHFA